MKKIKLSKYGTTNKGKHVAIVDDEDYDRLMKYDWHFHCGFSQRAFDENNNKIKMENQILKVDRKTVVFHLDLNRLNCQKSNLKISKSTRFMRSKKLKTSKYIGVCKNVRSYPSGVYTSWNARIVVNGKVKTVGCFKTEKEAAEAYDKKATEIFCKKAILNFR